MIFAELFIFLTSLLLFVLWKYRKPKNLPPGEWGLPVVGYVPFMDWKVSNTMEKLTKKHGKIFTLKIGARVFVVLTDYSLIKSAFQKHEISGRPFYFHYNTLKKSSHYGVILSQGHVWATNRRFALKTLRDFGFGKTPILDSIILNEANSLVQDLKKNDGKPVIIDWNVNVAVLNVTWKLVANRRYNVDDEYIKKFSQLTFDMFEDMEGPMALLTVFPWLIPILPDFIKNKWMRVSSLIKKREEILGLLKDTIKEHKKNLDVKNPKDLIDKYLIEFEEQKHNPEYQHWGDDDLLINIYDFFLAGHETTSSTIRWFFLYMAKYQDVQKQVQKQIDEHVPRGQEISLHDKDRLTYLEALTNEVNRHVSFLPNALPHEVTEDIIFEGYNIPKGTIMVPDMEGCHKNPKYWKYPNDFSLENFLDEEGNIIRSKEGYLPFSLGRRVCLGESLAKMELYVFMGSILQNFEISEPDGQNVSLIPRPNVNLFNYAPKFEVILKARN